MNFNFNADLLNAISSKSLETPTILNPTTTFIQPINEITSQIKNDPTNIYNNIIESNKYKRKVYFPKQIGVNYVGLLIGPKGAYQKRLESQTNCKILIRGK
jgi:hypothetical protein